MIFADHPESNKYCWSRASTWFSTSRLSRLSLSSFHLSLKAPVKMQFLAVAALAGLAVASPVADNGYASYGTYDGAGAKGPYASYGSYKGAGQGGSSPPPTTPNPTGPQIPFKFPLPNGFPNIAVPSDALNAISKQARGTLPNGALPTKLSDDSATQLQVIAANELFEVSPALYHCPFEKSTAS